MVFGFIITQIKRQFKRLNNKKTIVNNLSEQEYN